MTGQDFRRFVSPKDAGTAPDPDRRVGWTSGRSAVALDSRRAHRPLSRRRRRFLPKRRSPVSSCIAGNSRPLILRNVHDRVEAEQKIQSLTAETELLREELQALHHDEALIGESQALRQVLRDIGQVAETDATVLILGETGTGKELVARAIHAASTRRARQLIIVNCAAIPATLIESELFGHEAGAFTGATKKREGRFALADKGTIFLDEIGELPLDLQAKLLRVLQEGEFDPVGSSSTKKVNVRVLAATNRDLEKSVREGQFREDLFYRLNVFPLRLPPLRERGDDVVRLASAFARRFATKMGRTIAPLTADYARRLKGYSWPGNVRELQNVIERAVITATDGQLNLDRALPEATTTLTLHSDRTSEPRPGHHSHRERTGGTGTREYHARARRREVESLRREGRGDTARHERLDPLVTHESVEDSETSLNRDFSRRS